MFESNVIMLIAVSHITYDVCIQSNIAIWTTTTRNKTKPIKLNWILIISIQRKEKDQIWLWLINIIWMLLFGAFSVVTVILYNKSMFNQLDQFDQWISYNTLSLSLSLDFLYHSL